MVSEVSVHGRLLHCFWVFGETEHHDKDYVVKHICSPHGSYEKKRKRDREEGAHRQNTPIKTYYSDLLLPTTIHVLEILPPSNSPLGMN
jgi:hypothetical protein